MILDTFSIYFYEAIFTCSAQKKTLETPKSQFKMCLSNNRCHIWEKGLAYKNEIVSIDVYETE